MRHFDYPNFMKWMISIVVMIVFLPAGGRSDGAVVRVKVSGITSLVGTVRATLDGSEAAFTNQVQSQLTGEAVVVGTEQELVFRDVPAGVYAIKVIQDENDDQKLNQNILGIPSEKYGISNNVKGKFGLPSFSDASFNVDEGETLISITISNHSFI